MLIRDVVWICGGALLALTVFLPLGQGSVSVNRVNLDSAETWTFVVPSLLSAVIVALRRLPARVAIATISALPLPTTWFIVTWSGTYKAHPMVGYYVGVFAVTVFAFAALFEVLAGCVALSRSLADRSRSAA